MPQRHEASVDSRGERLAVDIGHNRALEGGIWSSQQDLNDGILATVDGGGADRLFCHSGLRRDGHHEGRKLGCIPRCGSLQLPAARYLAHREADDTVGTRRTRGGWRNRRR